MFSKPAHHDLPEPVELKNVLKTDLGSAYFYEKMVIFEANEGVTISYETAFSMLVKGLTFIENTSWAYISNRVNSYSLNPQDYIYLEKIPELKGIAIVFNNKIGKRNAKMEATFFNKPFESFSTLSKAYTWAKKLVDEETKII